MTVPSACDLKGRTCKPCEGGVPRIDPAAAVPLLAAVPGWRLTHEGTRIRRDWTLRNFRAGMGFLDAVAEIAEQEQHHPDLHLEGYRNVWIEIHTHAIGGLSENDFILAAKIDAVAPA